jgi:hypothetical protein
VFWRDKRLMGIVVLSDLATMRQDHSAEDVFAGVSRPTGH